MPTLLTLGEKLEQGHYTVIREIGTGGMGVVYQCRDEFLLRDVAIKMLLPELMSDSTNLETFTQEARLAAQLEHPNIVTIYDIGVEARELHEHHFVAMEYLPGGSLSNQLTFGPLSVEHCLNWMKQLASALSFAHKRTVVHQDIKADNIFITNEGDVKIGDFGLAKLLVGRVHYNAQTRGMGTPAYMSPELCRGEAQDYRSDIYSLGVLFFEMATGQLPFQARGMIDMAMKHTSAPIPSVRRLSPQVPEILEKVVHKMMAKDPDDRYQSAADILLVLDELIFEMRVNRLGLRSKGLLKSSGSIEIDQAHLKEAEANQEREKGAQAREAERERTPGQPAGDKKGLEQNGGKGATPPRGSQMPARRPADSTQARISAARLGALLKKEGLKALELVWSFKSNGPIGWSAAPITDRDERILYVSSTDSTLYAINMTSGSKLWTYRTEAPIIAGPTLLNDKVITINSKGDIAMLAARDGILLWALKTGLKVVATPTLVKDVMIVTSLDGKVQAIDTRRSLVKWVYDCGESVVSAVQSHGDQLFFGTKEGTVHCLDLESGRPIWQLQADGPVLAGCAASVDFIYFGTQKGTFYCLEAASGRLVWDYPTSRPITSRPVIVFTTVVFCSQDKWLYCCEKYVGGLVWKGAVRGTTLANLVTVQDSILTVTREGWMQAFSINNGEMKWQRDLARCVESTPLVTSNMLFVPTVEGDVLAYSLNPSELVEKTA